MTTRFMEKIELPENPRILINLAGSLGDLVRATVILAPIRKRYPKATITWVVDQKWAEVLEGNAFIDELVILERKKGILGLVSVWRELQKRKFDVSLDLQRHLRSGSFTWFAAAPSRLGFSPKDSKEGNWIFQNRYIEKYDPSKSKIVHYLSFCDLLEVPYKEPYQFGFSKNEFPVPRELKDRKYVVIVFGSTWDSKNWVAEGYGALLSQLQGNDFSIVFVGDSSQIELGRKAEALFSESSNVFNFIGKTPLRELFALIAHSQAATGPDSGPGHVASAFQVPYVTLFGPTDPARVSPWGARDLVVRSNIACSPCWRRQCPGLNKICMRLISPHEVAEKLVEAMNRPR